MSEIYMIRRLDGLIWWLLLWLLGLYFAAKRSGLVDVAAFENRQLLIAAKFINISSLFILLPGVIRRKELKRLANNKMSMYSSPPNINKQPVVCSICCFDLNSIGQRNKP